MFPRTSFRDDNVQILLSRIGLSEQQILDFNDEELNAFVPNVMSEVELMLIKLAKRNQGVIFDRYYRVVGKVEKKWVSMDDGKDRAEVGSCVLCDEEGVVVTALHNVDVDVSKAMKDSVKITVFLPNTIKGRFKYAAEIIKADKDLDLALLKPLKPNERHNDIQYFSHWASRVPSFLAKVYLISYPAILDHEFPLRKVKGDLPTLHEGRIAYVEDREALATYMSFSGCSGGLVICFNEDGVGSASGIHIGTMHESEALDAWSKSKLGELNANLSHKAAYGHYMFCVAKFLESYVLKEPMPTLFDRQKKKECHQVAFNPIERCHQLDNKESKKYRRVVSRRFLKRIIEKVVAVQDSGSDVQEETESLFGLAGVQSGLAVCAMEYDYTDGPNGPGHWGDLSTDWALCSTGQEQSPIDVNTFHVEVAPDAPLLETNYKDSNAMLTIGNHGIKVCWPDKDGGSIIIDGTVYTVTEVCFHHPSEHTIDGVRFPLEMHVVHISSDGNSTAVVGLLFHIGPEEDTFLAEVITRRIASMLENNRSVEDVGLVSLTYPKFSKDYYRYQGSLTTPPCTEGVIWILMTKTFSITLSQLSAIKQAIPDANARPLQPINGRRVQLQRVKYTKPKRHRSDSYIFKGGNKKLKSQANYSSKQNSLSEKGGSTDRRKNVPRRSPTLTRTSLS